MSAFLTFADPLSVSDLRLFLSRAARIENGLVRLNAVNEVVAVYTAVLSPRGLLDRVPTVLALRTFAVLAGKLHDGLVSAGAMIDRLDCLNLGLIRTDSDSGRKATPLTIELPEPESVAAAKTNWTGISPPRNGWREVGEIAASSLEEQSHAGIAEVASTLPRGGGEQLVWRVRARVWGAVMPGAEGLPAGAAFAAESLGFLGGGNEKVPIFEAGSWLRLSLQRGHVLVKTVD